MTLRASLLAVSALVLAIQSGAGAADRPMTDEDVVRMFVAGHSVEAILREIERREPDFDLGPEMLQELRGVELPEPIIEAMQHRQGALQPAEEPPMPEVSPPDEGRPTVRVALNSGEQGGPRTISVRARVDPELAAEWDPRGSTVDLMLTDLALFLICETPEHVPDHWRLASPIGRDFRTVRRHRMLRFLSGAEETGESRRVKVELPPVLEAPVESDGPHDLAIGLAVRVHENYIAVVQDRFPGALPDTPLEVRVSGRSLRSLSVRFVHEDDESADGEPSSGAGADDSITPAGETRPSRRPLPPS